MRAVWRLLDKRQHRQQRWTHSVDLVDTLLALVSFPLDPVPVKVCEKPIEVVGAGGVSVPLSSVITEKRLVLESLGFLCGPLAV